MILLDILETIQSLLLVGVFSLLIFLGSVKLINWFTKYSTKSYKNNSHYKKSGNKRNTVKGKVKYKK